MGLTVIDHTDEWWTARRSKRRTENGANTYSRDIVAHHVGRWAKLGHGQDVTVSTAPPLVAHEISADVVVQYLHTYDYAQPLVQPTRIAEALRAQGVGRVIFVAAYRPLVRLLEAAGFEALYVPMRVDVDWIRHRAGAAPARRYGKGRAVYFGNLTAAKQKHYQAFRRAFAKTGWRLDVVSSGDQAAALRQLRRYSYGVGVGRCALEMMALDLRVMLSGARFGGIITNAAEWDVQSSVNFNGRVITYDRSVLACAEAWGQVPDWSEAVDTYTATGVLDQHIHRLLG